MTLNFWQRKAQERWPFGAAYKRSSGRTPVESIHRARRMHGVPDDLPMLPDRPAGNVYIPLLGDDASNIPNTYTFLGLPAILEHLAYERQECERCDGTGKVDAVCRPIRPGSNPRDPVACPNCNGTGLDPDHARPGCAHCEGSGKGPQSGEWGRLLTASGHLPAECQNCNGTGLDPDYRKAQEWAEKLGVER